MCYMVGLYSCIVNFLLFLYFFFFKQKTAYAMRISDWSSDVCSSDLTPPASGGGTRLASQGYLDRRCRMNRGRVENWHLTVFRPDQQHYLGTSQDYRL